MALEPTIHYAAAFYLSIWLDSDQLFTQTLRYPQNLRDADQFGETLKCLAAAATHYSVIRGFKIDPSEQRLEHLLLALEERAQPGSDSEAISEVCALVESLKSFYSRELVSASSKFLWFRFRSPIVIYDSFAYEGLRRSCLSFNKQGFNPNRHFVDRYTDWYREYAEEWRRQYLSMRAIICHACGELPAFKKFTPAFDIEDSALHELVENEWFRERVFDSFLMLLGGLGLNGDGNRTK